MRDHQFKQHDINGWIVYVCVRCNECYSEVTAGTETYSLKDPKFEPDCDEAILKSVLDC